jgi:archaellum component FlaG (FlaF/FlaG flagellin family)
LNRWLTVFLVVPVLAASVAISACESTQDKAKKAQAEGAAIAQASQVKLTIPKPDKSIQVLDSVVLHDDYGDAVAVELKNTGKEPVVNAPILVKLIGAGGKQIGANDTAGLDLTLNHVPLIEPGQTVTWVNDQLQLPAAAKSAKVQVGPPETAAPKGPLPQIEAGPAKVENNPVGLLAKGSLKNKSQVEQLKLSVYVVARSGGKIVAAGRGVVKSLKPGKPGRYSAFFIGDPKGADVTVEAPPSTLQ